MNELEAEFLGLHIGDGTLYQTKRSIVWECRGSLDEQNYYDNNVKPLMEKLFDSQFKPKFRSGGAEGCYGIQSAKSIISRLLNKNSISPGSKLYTARIPESIKTSSRKNKLAFLRGLFDTDGCIRFDKINKQKRHTYPRIEFAFAAQGLRDDLSVILDDLGFRHYTWSKKAFKLCISGKELANRWFSEVKPANKKHLKRYQLWVARGYHK